MYNFVPTSDIKLNTRLATDDFLRIVRFPALMVIIPTVYLYFYNYVAHNAHFIMTCKVDLYLVAYL
jgi:hypothetical protein